MSERERYQPGVPCWVDTLADDPQATMQFYGELFGWQFEGPGETPGEPPGQYFVARIGDRDVAGVGSAPGGGGSTPPAWNTYISVASVDEAIGRAADAGATVLVGPVDAPPAGKLASLADPGGAVFCLWEPAARQGAQLVNEPSAWAMSFLSASDPDRAKVFYGDLFGWEAEPLEMGGAELTLWRLPGYVGGEPRQPVPRDVAAVMLPAGPEPGSAQTTGHWSVDFWIDDADAAAAKAPQIGGGVVVAPHDIPGFRSTVLADPHGAVFSVSALMKE